MFRHLSWCARFGGTALALMLLPMLAAAPSAWAGQHKTHDWRRLTDAERADLDRALAELSRNMQRLGDKLARDFRDFGEDDDWQELANLGERIRRQVEREVDAEGIADRVQRELEAADWNISSDEIQQIVREATRAAGRAARDAGHIARDASRAAGRAIRDAHRRCDCQD